MLEFTVPWVIPSKKNNMVCVGRRPKPSAVVEAHEDAVAALALAQIARDLDLVGPRGWEALARLASERIRPRSGVGTRTLWKALDPLRARIRAVPGAEDIEVEVVEVIGRAPGEDATVVRVRPLGDPPPRRRTGRRHDLANVPALILDALEGVAYRDDRQVVSLSVRRRFDDR